MLKRDAWVIDKNFRPGTGSLLKYILRQATPVARSPKPVEKRAISRTIADYGLTLRHETRLRIVSAANEILPESCPRLMAEVLTDTGVRP